jgi:hypothetical protein
MDQRRATARTPELDARSIRELFAELLSGAAEQLGAQPSPLASSYLLELLEERLRRPGGMGRAREGERGLGEALLEARQERGARRVEKLRALGDRALFVAGVFGESLCRNLVDIDYYGQIGRAAYADVSLSLAVHTREATWPGLFRELAEDFPTFVDLLAEVGDRTRARQADLLRVYDRYVRTGSERDRRRLVRRGVVPLAPRQLGRWQ